MTFEEFWTLYEVATDMAEDKLVQFGISDGNVITMAWVVEEWSPVRSEAVDMMDRARLHALAMQETVLVR